MNRDQKQGNWLQTSGKIRERWGKLTDDDQTMNAGKRDQIAGLLQQRYGDAIEKAQNQPDKVAR